jgi:NAD(P)-dependent dehydrogenase (short-subunit alcohol dehydrogenase family)
MVASASVQLSHSNIRVNAVAPGFTSSSILACADQVEKGGEFKLSQTAEEVEVVKKQHAKFFEEAGLLANPQYYYNRTQEAEEIANVAVFLASDLGKAVNGQTLLADSGKTAAAMGEGCTGPIPPIQPLEL